MDLLGPAGREEEVDAIPPAEHHAPLEIWREEVRPGAPRQLVDHERHVPERQCEPRRHVLHELLRAVAVDEPEAAPPIGGMERFQAGDERLVALYDFIPWLRRPDPLEVGHDHPPGAARDPSKEGALPRAGLPDHPDERADLLRPTHFRRQLKKPFIVPSIFAALAIIGS